MTDQMSKQNRKYMIAYSRFKLMEDLEKQFNSLQLTEPVQEIEQPFKLEHLTFMSKFNPKEYKIRVIPHGKKVKIVSNTQFISIYEFKSKRSYTIDIKADSFELLAIYSSIPNIYFVTEFLSFRRYNYKKIDSKVVKYFVNCNFPNGIIVNNDELTIKLLPQYDFSMELIQELRIVKLNHSRCIEIQSSEKSSECYKLFSKRQFMKKSFSIDLNLNKGVFSTSDNVEIKCMKTDDVRSGVAKISFRFQQVRLLKQLLEIINKHENDSHFEVEQENIFEIKTFVKFVSSAKKKFHLVFSLNDVKDLLSSKIDEIEKSFS